MSRELKIDVSRMMTLVGAAVLSDFDPCSEEMSNEQLAKAVFTKMIEQYNYEVTYQRDAACALR